MRPILIYTAGKDITVEASSGDCSYVRTFARAATSLGYDVHIFVIAHRPRVEITDYGTVHCISVFPIPLRGSLATFHARQLSSAIVRFASSRPGPFLIHGFGGYGHSGVLAARKLQRRGAQVIRLQSSYTVYVEEARSKYEGSRTFARFPERLRFWLEYWEVRLFMDPYEGALHHQAHLTMVNYRAVHQMLGKRFGFDFPYRLIPYTTESAQQATASAQSKISAQENERAHPPRIVSISRHDPRKGIGTLLHALAILHRKGVPFQATVAGSGPLWETHQDLVVQLGLEKVVSLPGYVPDVEKLRNENDVFVLPSLAEQSGSLSLLEAMYTGIASVASACDGIPEDIVDGDNGLLFPPGNPVILAAKLEQLLTQPDLRDRLARRARETFDSRFGATIFRDCLREIYTSFGFPPPAIPADCEKQ